MSLSERRRYPRLKFDGSLRFRDVFKPSEAYSEARVRDLSAGGIRMTAESFRPPGDRWVVVLDLPGLERPVRAISRVAWSQKEPVSERYDCGLEFIGISPEDREALAGHVGRGGCGILKA